MSTTDSRSTASVAPSASSHGGGLRNASRGVRIALGVLSVLVLCLLGTTVVLVKAAQEYFRNALAIRLDPAGLKFYAGDRANPLKTGGPLLLFFGDSRALMWSEPTAPTGYRIVNHGIGNQTTEQILLRVEGDVVGLHPTVVVLEAGVNDLKSIAEFPEQSAEIISDCEANLARIVDRCRQTGATVVLVSIFDIGDVPLWRQPFWSKDVMAAVRKVNAFLAGLAGPRVVLFEANSVLTDSDEHITRDYQMDYLHLTSAGYSALNAKLVPLLATLPKSTESMPPVFTPPSL